MKFQLVLESNGGKNEKKGNLSLKQILRETDEMILNEKKMVK